MLSHHEIEALKQCAMLVQLNSERQVTKMVKSMNFKNETIIKDRYDKSVLALNAVTKLEDNIKSWN